MEVINNAGHYGTGGVGGHWTTLQLTRAAWYSSKRNPRRIRLYASFKTNHTFTVSMTVTLVYRRTFEPNKRLPPWCVAPSLSAELRAGVHMFQSAFLHIIFDIKQHP